MTLLHTRTHTPPQLRWGYCHRHLEAFAVYDGRAGLVVFLLGDPRLLEGGHGGEDGAANPDRVLASRVLSSTAEPYVFTTGALVAAAPSVGALRDPETACCLLIARHWPRARRASSAATLNDAESKPRKARRRAPPKRRRSSCGCGGGVKQGCCQGARAGGGAPQLSRWRGRGPFSIHAGVPPILGQRCTFQYLCPCFKPCRGGAGGVYQDRLGTKHIYTGKIWAQRNRGAFSAAQPTLKAQGTEI
jgi:hypothetical protein